MTRLAPTRSLYSVAVLAAATSIACSSEAARDTASDLSTAPPTVEILRPGWGDTVAGPQVVVALAARGITLRPPAQAEPGTGHLHLMIDQAVVPEGVVIPGGPGILHLGDGGTEAVVEGLLPGPHMVIAALGDANHVRIPGAGTDTVLFVLR